MSVNPSVAMGWASGALQRGGDRRHHPLGLVGRRGRGLRGDDASVEGEDGVGEGAANIDAEEHDPDVNRNWQRPNAAGERGPSGVRSRGQRGLQLLGFAQVLVRRAVTVMG